MFDMLTQAVTGLKVLDTSTKLRMNPMQLRKAGVVIQNMQAAGYDEEQMNKICSALFLDQSEELMVAAFTVFDPVMNLQIDNCCLPSVGHLGYASVTGRSRGSGWSGISQGFAVNG